MNESLNLARLIQMLLKFLESKYLVSTPVEECSVLVQKALSEVGLENLTIKKEVSPNYLLVAYSPGWIGKTLEIEFVFKKKQERTEVYVKWPYTEEVPQDKENPTEFQKQEQERKQRTERLIQKFKNRIGATDLRTR